MKKNNKLLVFCTLFAATTVIQAKQSKLVDIDNLNYVSQLENIEDEKNDNIFVEFIDGSVVEKPGKSIDKVPRSVIRSKKKKGQSDVNRYVAFDEDSYGVLTNNLTELDEDYVVSSKIFDLTGMNDAMEPFNRRMYAFNTQFDEKIAYPVSRVYGAIVPKPVRKGIANFYNNFKEIPTFVNSLLQLKPGKAINALGRLAVNSTVGVLGVMDVASHMGMQKDWETMGDTLGHYGVNTGSYLVLPLLGPSTVRDGVGTLADTAMESAARGAVEDALFFDKGVFDENIYGFTRPVMTGLNARSLISFKYGDLNSPFEYDLVRAFYYNFRKIQVAK